MSLPSPEQLESAGYLRLPSHAAAQERAEDTITKAELAAYYERRGDVLSPEDAAGAAFANVLAHREPVYEPGVVYESPAGGHARRTDDGMWEVFGAKGKFPHDFPERPLYRMVREGSRPARLDHGQVLAEITQWANLPREAAVDLAWRICKMAGGECDGG